ncbi:MAG: glutathione peroxidase [Burkholderiaceae bacterium]|jgi:glutathione peroxidase|nr:glutathione peroxidase [Betaproteobacteria bacterium]
MSLHSFSVRTIDGRDATLAEFSGRTLLIVNVASQCGLTPQYSGLQSLHARLADRGFAVLGFPCNQFGAQEPGSEAQIQNFCSSRFQVTFPMFAKVEVNGPGAHPLYQWLKSQSGGADIGWNFAKFLIDRSGALVSRHAPTDTPESLAPAIERLLG